MISTRALPSEILDAAEAGPGPLVDAIFRAGGAPLHQGQTTTFLYVGDAETVRLHHWMDMFPVLPPFERHLGTDLWSLTIDLPERSRIEYKIALRTDGRRRLILDPLNTRRARDPYGSNSVVTGPLYVRPDWSLPRAGVEAGTFSSVAIDSQIFGDTRHARIYLPAGAGPDPLPLLLAHDGSEYAEYAALTVVLDNLIASGDLPAMACVLSDPQERTAEYTGDHRHADHLVAELIPAVAERVAIDPTRRIALGASLGAVASLHAAHRHPGTFSGLVLQSGSFVTALGGRHRGGPVFEPVVAFMREWLEDPGQLPPQIHVSCGRFDGLIAENRAMAALFENLGVDVGYREVPDGHNWENWRDRLRAGLTHVAAQ